MERESDSLAAAQSLVAAGCYQTALKSLRLLPGESERKRVLQAAALLGTRQRDKAVALLDAVLAGLPGDSEALFYRARAHLQANEPMQAIALFKRLPPDYPGLGEALVAAYRRDARYREALDLAGTLPLSTETAYETGICWSHLGMAAPALCCFDAVLEEDSNHAAAWFASHAAAIDAAGIEEGLRRLRRATACRGAAGRYWGYLCATLLLLGRTGEAEDVYTARIARFPRRQQLVEATRAILPHVSKECRLFGMPPSLLRYALEQAAQPGLILEFGVRRGTSINQIAENAGQTVYGFDSFEGLPEDWGRERAGVMTTGRELPAVRDNVRLHAGWFADTLPAFLAAHAGTVRFVNIDSDIYSSAVTVLTALSPRLTAGSVLVFDEYIGNRTWRDDEFRAFQEFIEATEWAYEILAVSPFTKQVALRLCPPV